MKDKPNILLITTDQQRWDHLGLTGLSAIKTPHLDRLGNTGVCFERAYCPSPMCTPSRVSLLTGRYPSSHGAYSIGVSSEPFPTPTLPQILEKGGYRTAILGKTHFVRREDEESHMSGKKNPPDEFWESWNGPYLGFDHVQSSIGHTTNANPNQHYRVWLKKKGVLWQDWFPVAKGESYSPYRPGKWNIPTEFHDTEWITECTENLIQKLSIGKEPWFCWSSFQDPHEPYLCPDPWFSSVDRSKLKIFKQKQAHEFDDKPDVYGEIYDQNSGGSKYNTDGFGIPCADPKFFTEEEQLDALQATLGMVAFIDHAVGRIIEKLESTGQLENTIIIFTSDHGEYHGNHGFWGKGFPAYDDAQKVPLIIAGASIAKKSKANSIANLVDLPKTLLKMINLNIPRGMQGQDLSAFLKGKSTEGLDSTLIECRPTEKGPYQQTFVHKNHKLVIYDHTLEGELYNLDNDPEQYNNLWSNPDFSDLKSELLLKFTQFKMKNEGHLCSRLSFA